MELTTPATRSAVATTAEKETSDQFSFEEFFDFSNEEEQLFLDNTNHSADVFRSIKAESGDLLGDSSSNSSLGDFRSSILASELCVPYDDLAGAGVGIRVRGEVVFKWGHGEAPFHIRDVLSPTQTFSFRRIDPTRKTTTLELPTTFSIHIRTRQSPVKNPKIIREHEARCLPVDGRRSLHCQTAQTPQWRTGSMGPKILCNACGVRYKSGRLVPEYRPASSPTFVQTVHSNSHGKVLELRKRKEISIMGAGTNHHLHDHKKHSYMSCDRSDGEDYPIHRPDLES